MGNKLIMEDVTHGRSMKLSGNFLNHLAFWFVTLFATPLFIAVNNPEDVAIPFPALAVMLLTFTIVLSLMTLAASRLGGPVLAQRSGLLLGGFALVLAVQCNVIHELFYYGNFNGEAVNFQQYGQKYWYEWYGFLAAAIIVTVVLQWRLPKGLWLGLLPIVSSSLLLLPALITFQGSGRMASPDQDFDPGVFGFSRNGNLIHLVPDGFQSDIARQVLQENPELEAQFEGFTLFENHLGLFQGTAPSIPTILTGVPFDLDGGHDYQRVTPHVQDKGYPTALQEAGYRLDYTLISGAYCAAGADSCVVRPFNDMKARGYFRHQNEGRAYSARILADLTLFRLFPMFVKEKIYDSGHWYLSDTTLDGSSPWPDPVIREWTEHMTVTDGPPVFKFYHYIGTHIPPHWDADCTYVRNLERSRESYAAQALCILRGLAGLVSRLKEQGIYDQTAIVISGDHGCGIAPDDGLFEAQQSALPPSMMGSARPAFMIKEKHRQHALKYSSAPTSLVDVAPTALALAQVDQQNPPASALDLSENSERTRYFKPYVIRELYSGKPIPHASYRLDAHVRDSSAWLVDEIKPFRTAPSRYEPVNLNTGKDFIYGTRFSTSKPDNDASWINGRQLAFLISLPPGFEDPVTMKLGLHVPKWISDQSVSVSVNGRMVAEEMPIEMGKGYWTHLDIDLSGQALKAENNFVSLLFEKTGLPPGIDHWEAAGMINSIRLVKSRASRTSKADADLP